MGWIPFFSILVIPTGTTTGKRIVIDGINGTITMYDANNNPVIVESSAAGNLTFNGPNSNPSMSVGLVTDPVSGSTVPGISFHSTTPPSSQNGIIAMAQSGTPPSGYIAMQPPVMSGDSPRVGGFNDTVVAWSADGQAVVNTGWFRGGDTLADTSAKNSDPAFTADGAFHLYPQANWGAMTIFVPPTGSIEIEIYMQGHNGNSQGNSAAVGVQIALTNPPGTVLFAAQLNYSAFIVAPAAAFNSNVAAHLTFPVGQDILVNFIGQEITITPAYRFSNGSNVANVAIAVGRIAVHPLLYATGFT